MTALSLVLAWEMSPAFFHDLVAAFALPALMVLLVLQPLLDSIEIWIHYRIGILAPDFQSQTCIDNESSINMAFDTLVIP